MSEKPYEIVAQPFTLYVAAAGSAFPPIEQEPGDEWTKVGSSGDLNYTEEGVTIAKAQSLEPFRALGSPGPRKIFRTEEGVTVSLGLADISLEQYALAMQYATVETQAPDVGAAGHQQLALSVGLSLPHRALLVRGQAASPYGEGAAQYEMPIVVEVGEPEVAFVKGEPAGLALEYSVLEDPHASSLDERFGRLVVEHADELEAEP